MVQRIQRMVRRGLIRAVIAREGWRNLMGQGLLEIKAAIICQSVVRLFLARLKVIKRARVSLIKYDPYETLSYWYHPRTGITTWKRPKILTSRFRIRGELLPPGDQTGYPCRVIPLPPSGLEVVTKCMNCKSSAAVNCVQCDDSFCVPCYDSLHCKGKRKLHTAVRLVNCAYCNLQAAAKYCKTCVQLPAVSGTAQEMLRSNQRGVYCDSCFSCAHDQSEESLNAGTNDQKCRERMTVFTTNDPLVVDQQMHKTHYLSSHRFDNLVFPCEECNARGATWRCVDCSQVYCSTCLSGLHGLSGPFSHHTASALPYYTPLMHRNYLRDQREQIFQAGLNRVRMQAQGRQDGRYNECVIR